MRLACVFSKDSLSVTAQFNVAAQWKSLSARLAMISHLRHADRALLQSLERKVTGQWRKAAEPNSAEHPPTEFPSGRGGIGS